MSIRIQPRDPEIPADDPFKNDKLNREEPVAVLTNIICSVTGPCVMSVDAPWGSGKTTFLRMWEQHLRNQNVPVVSFNAWDTDFSGDPFIALSEEISAELEQFKSKSKDISSKIDRVYAVGKEVIKRSIPGLIRIGTSGIVDVNPIVEELSKAALSQMEEPGSDRFSSYRAGKDSLGKFRSALQDMATSLAESNSSKPLVVVIDELDRCRPLYAVELLEAAKHLFAVNHVVFVLAVNRAQLAHSIRALYGVEFDAPGYLRRFFDIDFNLPQADRKAFIDSMLESSGVTAYFSHYSGNQLERQLQPLIALFFANPEISLRTAGQAIHHLGLTLASLRSGRDPFGLELAVAMIVRTADYGMYSKFILGEVSDADVVDRLFAMPGLEGGRNIQGMHLFEATVILAYQGMSIAKSETREMSGSPLLERYKESAAKQAKEDPNSISLPYPAKVVQAVEGHQNQYALALNAHNAIQRIELLSSDLATLVSSGP